MSQHANDLCSSLVHDIFGELASQVFATLCRFGRLSSSDIVFHAKLHPGQVQHCLGFLVQQNLVFWYSPSGKEATAYYEPNTKNANTLLRFGRELGMVESRLGCLAATLLAEIHIAGKCCIHDLQTAFVVPREDSFCNGENLQQGNGMLRRNKMTYQSENHPVGPASFALALQSLVRADFVIIAHDSHHRSPTDNRHEAERQAQKLVAFKGTKKGTTKMQDKDLFQDTVKDILDDWTLACDKNRRDLSRRIEAYTQSHNTLKRPLPLDDTSFESERQKRRLVNGGNIQVNGRMSTTNWKAMDYQASDILLVNYDKLSALSKNESLVAKVSDLISAATSRIYSSLLRLVEDPGLSLESHGESSNSKKSDFLDFHITTNRIVSEIECIRDIGEGSHSTHNESSRIKPEDEPAFLDSITELPQAELVRYHLSLLAEHPAKFLVHHPAEGVSQESWTIPFSSLFSRLRLLAIKETVQSRFGVGASRIASILLEKGKLDEKTLASTSLLNPKTMRVALAQMHEAGFLELQEIPRDSNRQPSRTIFLWFFDHERSARKIADDAYKTMARLITRLHLERESVRGILAKANRSDVAGNEETFLSKTELNMIDSWKTKERKIFGQLHRLDEMLCLVYSEQNEAVGLHRLNGG